MSWQEELRNLDEELASGRLSADDYRIRRDQVLSSAVAYGDAPQQPGQQPGTPQPPAGPQGQPQQQPGQPSADSTQIIAPVNQPPGDGAERTQVVPAWQQQQAQQPADPNRTQVVPPVASPPGGFPQQGQPSPAGGFPQQHGYQQQPQQGWNAPEADAAPPWGGSDFPPISPVGSTEWVKQGPELFDDKPRGKGGKIAVIAIVAVLVLGGLGVGGYFLFSGGGDPQATDPNTPPQSQSQAPPPSSTKVLTPQEKLLERIPEQSGTPDPKSGVIKVGEAASITGMEQGEIDLVTAEGVKEVIYRGSEKQPDETGPQKAKISITIIPMNNPGGAQDLVSKLRQYQTSHGFVHITDTVLPGIPTKVNFHKKVEGDSGDYRGTWVSGNNIIRVDVVQNPLGGGPGEAALSGTYQRAVKQGLLENFPATN